MGRKGIGRQTYFAIVGFLVVGLFGVMVLLQLNFLKDLSTTTEVKSAAAYERLGVTEEILNAGCATNGRSIFRYDAVKDGELSCIDAGRSIGLRFTVEKGGGEEVYSYAIRGATVSELSGGEVFQYSGEPRTYEIVLEDGPAMYRGELQVAITGGGWSCMAAHGTCIDEGELCEGNSLQLDCGRGKTCCQPRRR